jgi:hypothetical protein
MWIFVLPVIVASPVASLAQPAPPPLASPVQVFQAGVNATYGSTNCTPHGDGVTDDTACFSAALQAGDVLVKAFPNGSAAVYMINSAGEVNWRIFMPANRNVRCDTNDNAAGGSVAFTSPSGAGSSFGWTAFVYYQVSGGSWFWCQFPRSQLQYYWSANGSGTDRL